jgi:hypothetical protein
MCLNRRQYLDLIPDQHPRRRGATHLIIKLACQSGELPRSLFAEGVELPAHCENDRKCGGFGDVYRGQLGRRPVAVKKPRLVGCGSSDYKVIRRRCIRGVI